MKKTMKKAVLLVSAFVLFFTVNFTFARSPIPVIYPVDPAIEQIVSWLTSLQNQVNNLKLTPGPAGPQGTQGEAGPAGPQGPQGQNLHLLDGNNQDLGLLVDVDAAQGKYSTLFTVQYWPVKLMVEFTYNNGSYIPELGKNRIDVYFGWYDCQGSSYFVDAKETAAPQTLYYDEYGYFVISGYYLPPERQHAQSKRSNGICENGNYDIPETWDVEYIDPSSLPFTLPLARPLQVVSQ